MKARNAILTGASHGIGPYIARALAARGTNLLLVARSEPELARLGRELRTRDTKVAVAAIDLAGRRAAEQVAAAAAAELGTVDVLVNNAALELQRRFHTLDIDEIENVIRVDLTTPIALRPGSSEPWLGLAGTLRRQGELKQADEAFASAFAAEPTNAQILWDRAQNLRQSGNAVESKKLLRQLAESTWQPRFQALAAQARWQLDQR